MTAKIVALGCVTTLFAMVNASGRPKPDCRAPKHTQGPRKASALWQLKDIRERSAGYERWRYLCEWCYQYKHDTTRGDFVADLGSLPDKKDYLMQVDYCKIGKEVRPRPLRGEVTQPYKKCNLKVGAIVTAVKMSKGRVEFSTKGKTREINRKEWDSHFKLLKGKIHVGPFNNVINFDGYFGEEAWGPWYSDNGKHYRIHNKQKFEVVYHELYNRVWYVGPKQLWFDIRKNAWYKSVYLNNQNLGTNRGYTYYMYPWDKQSQRFGHWQIFGHSPRHEQVRKKWAAEECFRKQQKI